MIEEDGSDQAAALWNSAYPTASSILSYPEGRAALASARRAGRLPGQRYMHSISDFEVRYGGLAAVGVYPELVRAAGAQAETLGLRGYDAVHLASALDLGQREVTFVTWDEDLAQAAVSTGLAVAGAPA